jgi:hypothetical protein
MTRAPTRTCTRPQGCDPWLAAKTLSARPILGIEDTKNAKTFNNQDSLMVTHLTTN